jgi:hypothetical protein
MNETSRPSIAIVLTPRGLSRIHAATYVGISPSLFDQMVKDGRMPGPKRINTRTVWDVRALDKAFDLLPGDSSGAGSDDDWNDISA